MRSILVLVCIFTVTFSAQAQLFGKHWEKGYYISSSGKKTEGLISWSAPSRGLFKGKGDFFFYKTNEDADKIKISTDTTERFVMGADSFVVSHYADLAKFPVLKVMLNNKIRLYQSVVMTQTGGTMMPGAGGVMMMRPGFSVNSSTIYYGTSPDDLTVLKRSNFMEVMSKIMADNPQAVAAIQNKSYRYGDLPDLITYYNRGPNWGHASAPADSLKKPDTN